ncbi:unnamed protein product [Durusdinium trenchii]|uniref:Uncharacterized protein n=1 Tax=Durusdinium trenchii TaxID=1381693 RepID=A0ABP0JDV5_9DINO
MTLTQNCRRTLSRFAGKRNIKFPLLFGVDTVQFRKYSTAAERSRKQSEASQRSVRLDWLRQGHTGHLEDFTSALREELQNIQDEEAAEAEPEAGQDGNAEMDEMD